MLPMLLLQCYNAITADTMLQPHVQWCNRAYNANATPPPRAARRVAFAGSSFSNIYPTNTAATARGPDPCGALNSVRFWRVMCFLEVCLRSMRPQATANIPARNFLLKSGHSLGFRRCNPADRSHKRPRTALRPITYLTPYFWRGDLDFDASVRPQATASDRKRPHH